MAQKTIRPEFRQESQDFEAQRRAVIEEAEAAIRKSLEEYRDAFRKQAKDRAEEAGF